MTYVPDHRGGLKKVIPASFYSSTDKPLATHSTIHLRMHAFELKSRPYLSIATQSFENFVRSELRRRGHAVDVVLVGFDEEGSRFRITAIRWKPDNARDTFREEVSKEELERAANNPLSRTEKLFEVVDQLVTRLHRQILRHDRAGFPGTYTERDLDAPLV